MNCRTTRAARKCRRRIRVKPKIRRSVPRPRVKALRRKGARCGLFSAPGLPPARLPRGGWVVGHAHAQKAHEQFLFTVTRAETGLDLLHHAQERLAEEVVNLQGLAAQNLEGNFVGRQQAAQRLFLAEQQQPEQPYGVDVIVSLRGAKGLRQFKVGQMQ